MLRLWWLHKVSAGKNFFSNNSYASSIYNDEYENLRGKVKLKQSRRVFRTQSNIKVKYFLEILNGFKALNVFAKISILDVLMGSEYASALK